MKLPKNIFKLFPKGPYCYTSLGGFIYEKGKLPYIKTKVCPFYKHEEGVCGSCSAFDIEIDDQVKSCGINKGY